ncbi:MAG: FAD:protein FMN transferase [Verrucomicrobiota bacterium]
MTQIFSDYLPESELSLFARTPPGQEQVLSPDLFRALSLSEKLHSESKGAFDVTAGPFIRLWRLSRKSHRLPSAELLESARSRTGMSFLVLDPIRFSATKLVDGMLFDLGGIAKGYAADEALEILKMAGLSQSLIAASGDVVVGDPPPGTGFWRIELRTFPATTSQSSKIAVALTNAAVSTSGDTQQYIEIDGQRYSHIVSPTTGLGLTERIAVSVIAPNATTSDSYATTVALLGKKEGLQFIENKREIECRIVGLQHGQEVVIASNGFHQFEEKRGSKKDPITSP